jgi:hypothetical protein
MVCQHLCSTLRHTRACHHTVIGVVSHGRATREKPASEVTRITAPNRHGMYMSTANDCALREHLHSASWQFHCTKALLLES